MVTQGKLSVLNNEQEIASPVVSCRSAFLQIRTWIPNPAFAFHPHVNSGRHTTSLLLVPLRHFALNTASELLAALQLRATQVQLTSIAAHIVLGAGHSQ